MKFLHLVIAVVAFMAINSESKPQQPQIIVNDYQDHAPITYHTVPTAQTIKPTAIRVSRGAGDNCCKRVQATYTGNQKGGAYEGQSSKFTFYTKQEGNINDKPRYVSDSGEHSIWYQGGKWQVGKIESQGSNYAGLTTKSTDDCPNEPVYNWRYYDSDDEEWYNAGEGFSIWCD